jgi:molybdate transport system substrate-binding protein
MSAVAEIKLISANGMRQVIGDTTAAFERASALTLAVTVVETGEIRRRLLAGDAYDVVIVPAAVQDELIAAGAVMPGPAPVIRLGFGLAARAGAAPDVSTPEALRRAFLAADKVLITDPATGGISGVHLMKVLDRLGIAEAMKGKLVAGRGRELHAARVVAGEADLAVQAEHEIRSVPGAVFLDYPDDFREPIVFTAGLGTRADVAAARRYLGFLKGPEVATAIAAHHLSPA